MNINLSMEDVQTVREALQDLRAKASRKRDEVRESSDAEGIDLLLANQRFQHIAQTLALVESEVGKHFSNEMLIHWQRVTAE